MVVIWIEWVTYRKGQPGFSIQARELSFKNWNRGIHHVELEGSSNFGTPGPG